uniref:Sulfate transport ATP-binding protein n=1 Tax=Takakia lepidozioides TaxID=37425 RepID=A0A0S3QP22_TAKLE|nr:sulfate transport ATP-binding protein [Takakia lepidozioides]UPM51635.1 sulfate transport ATP-binding protein [Takakia lepidozioides]BAT70094.1 sulfate transport ATP-binding protein [Takakia lepidozioides]
MSILVHEVSKSLGDSKVLDRVSFYVPEVSLVALLGPSGSGKSSLLRIIAGLDNPDCGSIWLHGRDMTNISTQYRRMAFVFQHYALFKHMTVHENISFGLRLRGFPHQKIKKKVKDLLDCLRISDISFQYPTQISGGQKQRVALARSLAIRPDFLLLDEPFGALDGELRRHLSKWLRRYLKDHKITTIMVTHDQEEAISMADEIIILKEGRLLQQGKPKNLYDQPIDHFVGFFLGSLIEIPQFNKSFENLAKDIVQPDDDKKIMTFTSDPIWAELFENRAINKYQFFLRPYELHINYQRDSNATSVRIKKIIYKRTFVQLDLFVTSFSWNFTIPIGYQASRKLHIESFIQILYIKPRIPVFLRAYPLSKKLVSLRK